MNFQKIISNTKLLVFLIVLMSIPAILPLFHKGFFPLQDSVFVVRIYEAARDLKDLQFPMRWAPDLRYGEPLFNFYAPLPYYVGGILSFTPLSIVDTSKVMLGLSFILSGIAMFFLGKELFGKWGGVIAASLYMYAPYHSVDLYVRGALSEAWSLVFFPLIFLFVYKLRAKQTINNLLCLSLSLAGLFVTHNIMTLIFVPFIFVWAVFLAFQKRGEIPGRFVQYFCLSFLLAAGLAASYLLPAFFEKELVQSAKLTSGYYDFRAHFVEISQFFSTFWGYGPSVWGPNDGLSFQVGLVHWGLFILTILLVLVIKSFRKLYLGLVAVLAFEFLFSLFMQHNRSTPIWTTFSLLSFVQFPWRFLGITIFVSSLLVGSLGFFINKKTAILAIVGIGAFILYYNQFFHPQFFYSNRTDQDYIAGIFLKNEGFLPRDYVPVFVKKESIEYKMDKPTAVEGAISISSFVLHSSWAKAQIESTQSAKIAFPITYFPGWSITEGNKTAPAQPNGSGTIQMNIPKGRSVINLNFDNTPIRTVGDALSMFSLIIAGILFYIGLLSKGRRLM